ncbi:MAG: hypothetical protein L6Q84_08490 [Polyangiaceae bacterium]|nr:hypothetical protein [Polyangiaceae bacterium]
MTTFESGKPIKAADVNANFKALSEAVSALEKKRPLATSPNGTTYSVDAVFKGTSAAATTGKITSGALVGYAAAKKICESDVSSPSAHMCSSAEMVRSAAIGVAMPQGYTWIATGLSESDQGLGSIAERLKVDCYGFTWENTTDPKVSGATWQVSSGGAPGGAPSSGVCSAQYKIACCD